MSEIPFWIDNSTWLRYPHFFLSNAYSLFYHLKAWRSFDLIILWTLRYLMVFFSCVTGQGKEMNPFHFQWTLIFVTTSLNLGIGQGEFKLWWDFPTIVCSILKTFCKVEFKDIRKNLFPFFRPITRGFSLTAGTKSGHSWYWNQTELEGGGGYCWSQTVGCPTLLIAWWIVVTQLFSAAGLHLNQPLTFLAKS